MIIVHNRLIIDVQKVNTVHMHQARLVSSRRHNGKWNITIIIPLVLYKVVII